MSSIRESRTLNRAYFILLLILGALALSQPAWAQTATPEVSSKAEQIRLPAVVQETLTLEKTRETITRWSRIVERVEEQLATEELSAGSLKQLRETAVELQKELTKERPTVAGEVSRIKKLIDALGPPPKEGEPAESDEIAAEREQLNKRLVETDGTLKQLDLLVEKAKSALATISTAEGVALGNKLLQTTPSLLSRSTWKKSAENISTLGERAGNELSKWWKSERVRDSVKSGFLTFVAIAAGLSGLLAWILRRWISGRFGRDPAIEFPTYRMRVRAALSEAGARTAIPIIVALATYGTLRAEGFLFDFADKVAIGIALSVIALSILYGLPRSMLSPAMPQWRLARMGDDTAWRWYKYALTMAFIISIDTMLVIPAAELRPSPQLQTTYNFIIDFCYALVFLCIALDKRLWNFPSQPGAPAQGGQPAGTAGIVLPARSKWWALARTFIAIVAIAIPVTALARYGILSDFIARRMLATACAFLIALILHGLSRDLVAIFTHTSGHRARSGEAVSPLYVWTVLVLDIGLVLTMAFLIVPLWGGQWTSLLDQLGWSLSGFKIGDRVFSLTDVLAGLFAFIFVIVIVRSFQHFISRRVFQQMRMDSGVRDSLTTVIGYAGLVLAVIIAIATTGIDLSGLAIVAGALSVGVGFGLQSIVNNFVSGLILLAERPIKVGDWVHVGEHEGIVQRISVRSTEIKTFARASVIVPNSELISNSVVNWMHRERSGRIELPIGVGYDSDVEQVRELLLKIAADHETVLETPPPHVLFMDFGDNALMFEMRCFVGDVSRRLATASELRFSINAAFRKAGISIPYPQRDLHIKDAEGLADFISERQVVRKSRAKKPAAMTAATRRRKQKDEQIDPDD